MGAASTLLISFAGGRFWGCRPRRRIAGFSSTSSAASDLLARRLSRSPDRLDDGNDDPRRGDALRRDPAQRTLTGLKTATAFDARREAVPRLLAPHHILIGHPIELRWPDADLRTAHGHARSSA